MTYVTMSPLRTAAAAALCLAVSTPAAAHFSFDEDAAHQARDGDEIKTAPCGAANSTRGSTVHTYRPGETINLTINEWLPHPGYFRIAFDADGSDDFVVPSGTEGAGAGADCNNDPNCGKPENADYCNSPAVMWDNLDVHGSGEGGNRTWSVTLPNIECDNCTLQVIQMMNDLNVHASPVLGHGPYPKGDLYYSCIDIVLSNDADEVDFSPVTNNGMQCDSFDAAATMGGADTGGTGGATTDGTTGVSSTGGETTTTSPTGGTDDGGVATGTTGDMTAGATAGTTGVTGAATPGTTAPPATSDSGGCSVGPGLSQHTGFAAALWLMGLFSLLWTRRTRG